MFSCREKLVIKLNICLNYKVNSNMNVTSDEVNQINEQHEKTAAIMDQFVLNEHCKQGFDIDALIAQAQQDAKTLSEDLSTKTNKTTVTSRYYIKGRSLYLLQEIKLSDQALQKLLN